MAIIQSGIDSAVATVGDTSKGLFAELVDATGRKQAKNEVGAYQTRIEVQPSTLAAGTTYWAMRNSAGSDRAALITSIMLTLGFIGSASSSRSIFEIIRFSGANTTGGTQQVANKKSILTDLDSVVSDIRFAPAGLTTSSVTFASEPLALIAVTNQLAFGGSMDIVLTEPIVLASGEGLAIRAYNAVSSGAGLLGAVGWYERAV